MKELLCIVCPRGCRLQIEKTEQFTVSGNQCKRGVDFALAEMTNPTRVLTTTVRTSFPGVPVLPVRTEGEIPRGKIRALTDFLGSLSIDLPLGIGDPVAEDPLGLGIKVIATSNILKEQVNHE
jgi:CxxC motif-containing protein